MSTGRLFTTSKRMPFCPENILKYFQRELERFGLPKIPVHHLHDNCTSFHLAAGTNSESVQELVRHTTLAFIWRNLICFRTSGETCVQAQSMLYQHFSNANPIVKASDNSVRFYIERLYYCANRISGCCESVANTIDT
jgi:hypothetical protein